MSEVKKRTIWFQCSYREEHVIVTINDTKISTPIMISCPICSSRAMYNGGVLGLPYREPEYEFLRSSDDTKEIYLTKYTPKQ